MSLLANFQSIFIGVMGIAFLFFAAVMIHEFGHFIFAKLFGVRVETFSIGMGKKLWKRKWGETEYCISALPIGGYVQLTGPASKELMAYDDLVNAKKDLDSKKKELAAKPDDEKLKAEVAEAEASAAKAKAVFEQVGGAEEAERILPGITSMESEESETASWLMEDNIALRSKPFYAKFLIFSAGCAMNLLLAWFVSAAVFAVGFDVDVPPTMQVEDPIAISPLAEYDIQDGDQLHTFNGEEIKDWEHYGELTQKAQKDELSAVVTLLRGEGENAETITLRIPYTASSEVSGNVEAAENDMLAELAGKWTGSAYFHFDPYYEEIYIGGVSPNSPAEKAGIKLGDRIDSINGQEITKWGQVLMVTKTGEMPLKVVFSSPDDVTGEWQQKIAEIEPASGQIGIVRQYNNKVREKLAIPAAMVAAVHEVRGRIYQYTVGIYQLATGQINDPLRQLGGPVAIARLTYGFANSGLQIYLSWFVIINVILAVMNLLPIPLLDGGHILIAAIEAITGSPLPARPLMWLYKGSFGIIILLAVFLLGNDLWQNKWIALGSGKEAEPVKEVVEKVPSDLEEVSTDTPQTEPVNTDE